MSGAENRKSFRALTAKTRKPWSPAASALEKHKTGSGRRRHRWLWLLTLPAAILLLVLLAPTIMGLSPIRSFVVGKINDQLAGRLTVEDWLLAWISGVHASGISLNDHEPPSMGRTLVILVALESAACGCNSGSFSLAGLFCARIS